MNQTALTKGIERLVDLKLKAIDRIVKDLVDPLAKVGAPEELINKPYEQWTPEDLALLVKIYGQGDNTPLSNFIFKKTYEKVQALEQEETNNA